MNGLGDGDGNLVEKVLNEARESLERKYKLEAQGVVRVFLQFNAQSTKYKDHTL